MVCATRGWCQAGESPRVARTSAPGRIMHDGSSAGDHAGNQRMSFGMTAKMRPPAALFLLLGVPLAALASLDRPWQKITDPSAADAAKVFASPPPEYSAQFTWGWGGPVDREVIERDLDGMKALGVHAAIIEPKAGMKEPYLSPGYFDLVRVAVEEAKKRNMRLWIMDDGDYPSGLAGGKFTMERPDFRMQALAAPEHVDVAGRSHFTRELSPDVVCAVAISKSDQSTKVLDISKGRIDWTAPPGDWELVLGRKVFRSLPTRSANNPTGAKDNTHSLMDYLDPAADQLFRQWTFDNYQETIGDELGKTVLGFRGDEPAFTPNPWTPNLFAEFQRLKGYDLRPYLVRFPVGRRWRQAPMSDEERRAYADYCDVWSDLFRDNYFDMEASWCADHGVEMQLHIEHEEILPQLAISDGDYFKCFRHIQIPGIDIIWHQVWMDNPADFPKLASSAAHLYGHPRAMCEAFAAYRPPPNLEQARWLLNFLMVRGINRIEYMFWPASVSRGGASRAGGNRALRRATNSVASSSKGSATSASSEANRGRRPSAFLGGSRYYRDPGFPAVAAYVNRLSYLLGEGRPAAQIGLYIPSSSFWLADVDTSKKINDQFLALAHQLIEHQRDFDFVDEQALSTSVLTLKGNELVNLSGQSYRAIIVPPALAISRTALNNLRAFAKAGGTVIFIGPPPGLVPDRTFLHARGPADVSWATVHEANIAITPVVLQKLPRPDFLLDQPDPLVAYNHRRLRDADVYFIFNSGDDKASLHATLAGAGSGQLWDAVSGKITSLAVTRQSRGVVRVPLELEPWSTAVVVVQNAKTPAENVSH